ncbi:MAG: hypothetical protein HC888_03200, partial [Candidatus Competibacteraceae bacterium]|nr:hypothetical protein [Candidatus Competibacteraceae bacterium]
RPSATVAAPERTFTTEAQIAAWNAAVPSRKVFGLTAALDAQFQATLDAGLGDTEAFQLFLEKTSAMARHEKGAFVTLPWLLKTGEKGANWLRVLNCEYDWMIEKEEEKAPAVDYEKDADKPVTEQPPHPFWDTMYCDDLHGLIPAKRVIIANDWLNWRIFRLMEGETFEDFLEARELYKKAWKGDTEAAATLLDATGITVEDIGRFVEDMINGVERFPERFDFRKNRAQRKPWQELPRGKSSNAVPDPSRR